MVLIETNLLEATNLEADGCTSQQFERVCSVRALSCSANSQCGP